MTFLQINSYTRVLDDGKKTLDQRKELLNRQSLCKSSEFKIEIVEKKEPINYKKFCNKIFSDRHFISRKEFHNLILEHFGSNCSWYRKRMLDLKLISEKNKLIKPIL